MKVYPRIPTSRIKKYCSCLEFDTYYSNVDSFRRFGEDLIYHQIDRLKFKDKKSVSLIDFQDIY